MKHYLFFLSVAMLLFLSACKSAHSVSKVAESAQTTETSLTSAVTSTTLSDFISAISLQADSIVMWVQSEPSSRTPVFQDLPDSTLDGKHGTPTPTGTDKTAPRGSGVLPNNAIKVYGLHVNAASTVQQTTAVQKADSLSSSAKTSSAFEEREKSKLPACAYARLYIYGAITAAVAIAIALIRRKMKK